MVRFVTAAVSCGKGDFVPFSYRLDIDVPCQKVFMVPTTTVLHAARRVQYPISHRMKKYKMIARYSMAFFPT